jgi:hypothetical protein
MKTIGVCLRILCKCYEFLVRAYTLLFFGSLSDGSKLLVDLYTPDQLLLQDKLDLGLSDDQNHSGELLVLIPFRDRSEMTDQCLRYLSQQILFATIKVRTILINNRSETGETARWLAGVAKIHPTLNIQTFTADYDFNYSRLNNDGFRQFSTPETKWLLCLNNDVELLDKTIIRRMVSTLERVVEVGVVGCSLIYPSRRIQHLFAAPGVKIIAAHPLRGHPMNPMMAWFSKPARVVPAVTGAVMLVRAEEFTKVGMFDENLPTLGQDIILCLEMLNKLGKCSVSVNTGDVIHYESITKKPSFPKAEVDYIYQKYGSSLRDGRFYSTRISRWSEVPTLAFPFEPAYPAKWVIRSWN